MDKVNKKGDLNVLLHFMIETSNSCFNKCIKNLNNKLLSPEEQTCIESCADKHIFGYKRLLTLSEEWWKTENSNIFQ